VKVGEQAPGFELPDTDGSPQAFQTPAVVVFTCNHCPYALAWHDRLMDVARDYPDVHFYAINPNDAERYPHDSSEAMKERVSADGGWPMPYLRDESQDVARAYGARTTPDVFVIDADAALRYRGAPDADHGDESQNAQWLRDALNGLRAREDIALPETEPVGCSVKWRQ
jgi:peroxiredoxin